MLPDTPAAEAAKLFAAHGMPPEGLPPQTNVTLIDTGAELVLIDAGSGPKFQPTAGKLSENLEAAGIDPKKISKVVFTHGHADHLWGAIDDFDDAERFPNARYVVSAAEWDFWTHPDTPSRVPDWLKGMAIASARILTQIEKKVERRGAGDTVAPGMVYVGTPGHTPGHMAVGVENAGQRLLIAGDVFNNNAVSFAKPEWRVGGDFDRDQGITTRKQLLDQLATDRIPLIGFHLSWPGYGMVERRGTAYRFVPVCIPRAISTCNEDDDETVGACSLLLPPRCRPPRTRRTPPRGKRFIWFAGLAIRSGKPRRTASVLC